jgi:hypothetical protein
LGQFSTGWNKDTEIYIKNSFFSENFIQIRDIFIVKIPDSSFLTVFFGKGLSK